MLNFKKPSTTFLQKVEAGKGVSIIEILVIVSIITFALVSILGVAVFSLKVSLLTKETSKAKNIAEGTLEAIRNYRDNVDWDNDDLVDKYDGLGIVDTSPYHLEKSGDVPPKWMLISGSDTIDDFNREIVFEYVSRDPFSNDIEDPYNPANKDSDTKKAIVTISWKDKQIQLSTYFTNWK